MLLNKNLFFACIFLYFGSSIAQSMEFTLEVEPSMETLLAIADTDGDKKITIEDKVMDSFRIVSENKDTLEFSKVYHLSNLLQELALADLQGKDRLHISLKKIKEAPAARISRRIRDYFWDDLTRTIDRAGIKKILTDPKASDSAKNLYVAATDTAGIRYYMALEKDFPDLNVSILPKKITPEFVKSINEEPGLLALKIKDGRGVPFVVPGGRFNEMYGWDSYFEGIGLIIDGRIDLAKAMVDNFVYQINHYGKILNANRTYYLTRTQPPFMSSFVREVYHATEVEDKEWLRHSLEAAIKEYEQVWMEEGQRRVKNGLNRYFAQGLGIPPETEEGHFRDVLRKFATKHDMEVNEFTEKYKSGEIKDPELDKYFRHDRSMRESGHDTSWRLDGKAADLNPVGLNSLLYKYEKDFQYLIEKHFNGQFTTSLHVTYSDEYWGKRAEKRRRLMNRYMWNEEKGSFFDFNFQTGNQTDYISATNFYPLWAGMVSEDQAERMKENLLADLKTKGGILASARNSVEKAATGEVDRQWDYPYGWAPHQMLLWRGLLNYNYKKDTYELIYRWLWMITRNAVDYNGTIPEKYDVVNATHKVYAEYGNVGTKFDYITTSGFGWMNASYQLGLKLLPKKFIEELNELVSPELLF